MAQKRELWGPTKKQQYESKAFINHLKSHQHSQFSENTPPAGFYWGQSSPLAWYSIFSRSTLPRHPWEAMAAACECVTMWILCYRDSFNLSFSSKSSNFLAHNCSQCSPVIVFDSGGHPVPTVISDSSNSSVLLLFVFYWSISLKVR